MGSRALKAPMADKDEFVTLIESAAAGDQSSREELIRRTQDRLYRFCVYLCGNPQLASDLMQDTFIKVLENLKGLKSFDKFNSWLFTTARNLFIDHVRSPKNKIHGNIDDVSEDLVHESNDLNYQIRTVLDQMNPDDRTLILLVDMEQYSYQEAGEVLGISEAAVRSRLHRARQEFVKLYGAEGATSSKSSKVPE